MRKETQPEAEQAQNMDTTEFRLKDVRENMINYTPDQTTRVGGWYYTEPVYMGVRL